jgi:palmitoyltransferase
MQSKVEVNRVAINLWTARIIPIILAGVVGYATYVVVALLCGKAFGDNAELAADFAL